MHLHLPLQSQFQLLVVDASTLQCLFQFWCSPGFNSLSLSFCFCALSLAGLVVVVVVVAVSSSGSSSS